MPASLGKVAGAAWSIQRSILASRCACTWMCFASPSSKSTRWQPVDSMKDLMVPAYHRTSLPTNWTSQRLPMISLMLIVWSLRWRARCGAKAGRTWSTRWSGAKAERVLRGRLQQPDARHRGDQSRRSAGRTVCFKTQVAVQPASASKKYTGVLPLRHDTASHTLSVVSLETLALRYVRSIFD